jgi:hypothetical protein
MTQTAYQREWYQLNKERILAERREYYVANRERCNLADTKSRIDRHSKGEPIAFRMPCRLDDTKNTADFRSVRTDACAMTSLFHEETLQTTTYIQL